MGAAVVLHYIKGERLRAERSRVSLCEKCRLTLRAPYLAPLPFSTASSAAFTSAGLNGRDCNTHFISGVGRGL